MPTLYHSPQTRSDTVVDLFRMLGADVDIREVTIRRQDGSGAQDPDNPHPEKKVPYFVDGEDHVRERGAIMLYLTDKYPQAKLGPLAGEAGREVMAIPGSPLEKSEARQPPPEVVAAQEPDVR